MFDGFSFIQFYPTYERNISKSSSPIPPPPVNPPFSYHFPDRDFRSGNQRDYRAADFSRQKILHIELFKGFQQRSHGTGLGTVEINMQIADKVIGHVNPLFIGNNFVEQGHPELSVDISGNAFFYLSSHANSSSTCADSRHQFCRRTAAPLRRRAYSGEHPRHAHFAFAALREGRETRPHQGSLGLLFKAHRVLLFTTEYRHHGRR